MLIPEENLYVSDTPIEKENEDVLERKVFVNALSDSLINYQNEDSLVIGLYGSWGGRENFYFKYDEESYYE